jgi:hypothetical protein
MIRVATKPITPLNVQEISVIKPILYICWDLGSQFVFSLASNFLHMYVWGFGAFWGLGAEVHLAKYICGSQIWCTKWHLGNLMIILVVVNWTCKHPQGNCHSQWLVLLVSCLQFLSNWWNLWHRNLLICFLLLSIST